MIYLYFDSLALEDEPVYRVAKFLTESLAYFLEQRTAARRLARPDASVHLAFGLLDDGLSDAVCFSKDSLLFSGQERRHVCVVFQ